MMLAGLPDAAAVVPSSPRTIRFPPAFPSRRLPILRWSWVRIKLFSDDSEFCHGLITEPVTYVSSNPAVVTVAANGLACAGSWDSLASPLVCTPGGTGVAEVTAVALGVSSSPTTVYVHQHVDKVVISTVSTIPPAPNTPCLSVGQTIEYQARAFSRGADITSTVGSLTW